MQIKAVEIAIFIVSTLLGWSAFNIYNDHGHTQNLTVVLLWLAYIGTVLGYYFTKRVKKPLIEGFDHADFIILLVLFIAFIPVYLWLNDILPIQMNTDEIVVMNHANSFIKGAVPKDLLGISGYYGFPNFIFILFGWIAQQLGEVNITNLRNVHAAFGLLIVIPAYAFYRVFLPKLLAAGATMILMSSHALVGISRIVSRNNVTVLNELVAFLFLYLGLEKKCPYLSFLGGAIAGLTFYHYPTARITYILWLVFLVILGLFYRKKFRFRDLWNMAMISTLAFAMVVMPMAIASHKRPEAALPYSKRQLLFFEEGREENKSWYFETSISAAIKKNIMNGFSMFNKPIPDQGNIYLNHKHGFVDPLTGLLLWLGLICLILKNKKSTYEFLIASNFLFLWMIFMFVSNKTPKFSRAIIMLPFVSYLAVEGINVLLRGLDYLWNKIQNKQLLNSMFRNIIFSLIVVVIIFWNGIIYGDYIKKGIKHGDLIGGTTRYIEDRKETSQHFYIVQTSAYKFFISRFKSWVSHLTGNRDRGKIFKSQEEMIAADLQVPFSLFLEQPTWIVSRKKLINIYPNLKINRLTDQFVVIEVNENKTEFAIK